MKILRIGVVWLLIVGLSTPALAGDLRDSIAKAAEEEAQASPGGRSRALTWTGATLFVGGMAIGLYGFLNNKNGEFPEFGEAEATNKYLGTAGLITAFVGGTVLFVNARHASRSPTVTLKPGRMTVAKTVRW